MRACVRILARAPLAQASTPVHTHIATGCVPEEITIRLALTPFKDAEAKRLADLEAAKPKM